LSAAACSAHISKVRALRVIAIAFLTAIVGGILSVVASLYLTELYHVSNFEGGRGMLIFFALAPLGLLVGFIIGLVVALRSRGTGFGGFAKAQGIALGIAIGLAAVVSGILYLAADHPPKLDGKPIALEFELKIPPALKLQPSQVYRRYTPVFTLTIAITATRCSITTRSQVATASFLFRAKRRCSRKLLIVTSLFQSRTREGQVSLSNSSCARNRAKKTKRGRIG
jgi:MFS family permease